MEKTAQMEQGQSELAVFLKEVQENFANAGKKKGGWLRNLLSKLFA